MIKPEPNSPEAERILLSALFWRRESADLTLTALGPDDFFVDTHRRIFVACKALHAKGIEIHAQSVCMQLRDTNQLEPAGGVAAVAALFEGVESVASVDPYIAILRNKTRLRGLIRECMMIAAEAHKPQASEDEFISGAEQRIYAATALTAQPTAVMFYDLVQAELTRLQSVWSGNTEPQGVPSGLASLDEYIQGFRPGEVTVIAARPGMGKSALAANIAISVARSNHGDVQRGVFFASLEMTSAQTIRRSIASYARVQMRAIESGRTSNEELDRFLEHANELAQQPIFVDETTRMRPSQLRSQIRRLKSRFKREAGRDLSLVVVDYLQRMGSDVKRKERYNEVADNMNAIADAAKELDVAVLLLAQLNRENTKRQGKAQRPRMSDLAESGEIEKTAHNIVFIHRPEYYEQDKAAVPPHMRGLAELIVEKQRDGQTGIALSKFIPEHTAFEEPTDLDVQRWKSAPQEARGGGKRWNARA